MYTSSKHGVRHTLKERGALPESAAAPTCQTCHMEGGDHKVMTGWGFFGVRLPMPDDRKWAEDRRTILKAVGILTPQGEPGARMPLLDTIGLARQTDQAWREERKRMLSICSDCHSENFARQELRKGDRMIRKADMLMAEAIEIVAGLYRDGILDKPQKYEHPYPDLLAFHEATTPIEQELFRMFSKHRMRTFMGTFHNSPEYAFWEGWAKMKRDLTAIRHMAKELRKKE
jgi:cytochrome c553